MHKKNIVLSALLVAIAFYFYFSEKIKEDNARYAKEQTKILKELNPETIVSISGVVEGKPFELLKENEAWQMKSPYLDKGDAREINDLLNNVAEMSFDSNFIPEDGNYAEYGLEKPEAQFKFKSNAGKTYEINLGSLNVMGSKGYAKIGDNKNVYLLNYGDRNALLKTINAFRDKEIYTNNTEEITKIIIRKNNKNISLTKKEKAWFVNEKYLANEDLLQAIKSGLKNLKIKSFLSESLDNKNKYFDKENVLSLSFFGKETKLTLDVGNKENNQRYLVVEGKERIVSIDNAFIENFEIAENDFKQRKLFSLNPYNVSKVTLLYDAKEKVELKEKNNEWKINGLKKGNSNKIRDFIQAFTSLEIKEFNTGKTPVDAIEKLQVILANNDGKEEATTIYSDGKNNFVISHDGKELFEIKEANEIFLPVKSLEDMSVFQVDFAKYNSLIVKKDKKIVAFSKKDITWSAENKSTVDVNNLIWNLQDIQYIKAVETSEEKMEVLSLEFSGKTEKLTAKFLTDNIIEVNGRKYEVTPEGVDKITGYFE